MSLAALSSCLLCVKRIWVLVLIVWLLSCELTRMTSQISSSCFGFVMSSNVREAAGAELAAVLARLLLPAVREPLWLMLMVVTPSQPLTQQGCGLTPCHGLLLPEIGLGKSCFGWNVRA